MTGLINTWANFVTSQRLFIIGISGILLLAALFTGKTIPFDDTTERYFIADDPSLLNYRTLIELFGDNEYLIIGIEALPGSDDVFHPQTIQDMDAITNFLENHQYITQVRSLSNYQTILADGDDLSTDYLIDDIAAIATQPAILARARALIVSEKLAINTLISPDLQHARIAARVEYRSDTADHKIELINDFKAFLEREQIGSNSYVMHLSGFPYLSERFQTVAEEDMAVLIPVMGLLILIMLYINFRSIPATVLPVIVIGVGILFVDEIQSYLGLPHSTVDQALLPTLIIIGTGICVHVLVEFFHLINTGNSGIKAAQATIIQLWIPAFFTAITTSVGFYALSITKITPIKEFAIMGAIGPLVLFLLAMTLLPAMLSYINTLPAKLKRSVKTGVVSNLINKIPQFTLTHRNKILVIGCASALFAAFTLPSIIIDTNYVTLFKADSAVRQDILYLDEHFKGVVTLEIILDSGEIDAVKEPEFLRHIERFQQWIEAREPIGEVNSLVDYLKQINQALNADDPAFYRLPETREMTAQFLLLYGSAGANEDLSDIKDFEDRYARLTIPITNMPATDMVIELEAIQQRLDSEFGEGKAMLTGGIAMKTAQDTYAAEGMLRSFIIAFCVITLIFIALFKSFKYGILSIIPSILPILIAGGITGFLGINLDLSTMLIAAMTMGIAVDDAIHVMNQYLVAKRSGASTEHALEAAMHGSGRAVVFSSMILVLGFSVFSLASFTTIILLGLLGSAIMTFALLGDLLFLPAILYLIDGSQVQDNDE